MDIMLKLLRRVLLLAYEGLVDNDLTGIAISMGAGMCNVCVMYQGMSSLSFSVARGGDWIDDECSKRLWCFNCKSNSN